MQSEWLKCQRNPLCLRHLGSVLATCHPLLHSYSHHPLDSILKRESRRIYFETCHPSPKVRILDLPFDPLFGHLIFLSKLGKYMEKKDRLEVWYVPGLFLCFSKVLYQRLEPCEHVESIKTLAVFSPPSEIVCNFRCGCKAYRGLAYSQWFHGGCFKECVQDFQRIYHSWSGVY